MVWRFRTRRPKACTRSPATDERSRPTNPTAHRRRRLLLGRRQDGLHCRISFQARILLRERLSPLPLWIRSGRIEEEIGGGGGQIALTPACHRRRAIGPA